MDVPTDFDIDVMDIGVASSEHLAHLLRRLNGGPDLSEAVQEDERSRLPLGWRLNTVRVSPRAIKARDINLERLVSVVFDSFEVACSELVSQNLEVAQLVQQGVECRPQLKRLYTSHRSPLRARRLDTGVDATGRRWIFENDEQPGGLAIICHLDACFEVNETRWTKVWDTLTQGGCLVFLVSPEWGREYVSETRWLAGHLTLRGYEAYFVSTADADSLVIDQTGSVTIRGRRVSTIWRQFPVFEATDHIVALVRTAAAGNVEILPSIASWGNKVWFGLFWRHQDFFRAQMGEQHFEELARSIPYSIVVRSASDFPVTFATTAAEIRIASADSLIELPYSVRQNLVVKAAGANRHSARSKGVVIGQEQSDQIWRSGVTDVLLLCSRYKIPLVIQESHTPRLATVVAYNAKVRTLETVEMRFIERPWCVAGTVVSSVSYAVPAAVLKLHAKVDGCEIPRQL